MPFGQDGTDSGPVRQTTATSTAAIVYLGGLLLVFVVVVHEDVFDLARHVVHIYGSENRVSLKLGLLMHIH